MTPILHAAQVRAWDAYTIQHEPIASIDLMERACHAFANWFTKKFNVGQRVLVVCGPGNNGGDGLGIARILAKRKFNVEVWLVGDGDRSQDATINLERLPKSIRVRAVTEQIPTAEHLPEIVVDALFGSGLSKPLVGVFARVVDCINELPSTCIAVDVPSGLRLDDVSQGSIIRAHHTVTFQVPKLALLLPSHAEFVGDWVAVDIGLASGFLEEQKVSFTQWLIDEETTRGMRRSRKKFAHKGNFGRALLVAGGVGKMGAAVLASRAALRAGAGLVTVHVPANGYDIIQTSVPEAMASVDVNRDYFTEPADVAVYDVVGVGPGLGTHPDTVMGLRKLLNAGKPSVLDADALNIMSQHRGMLHLIPKGSILTPHPREFERLVGSWNDDFQKLRLQRELAQQTGAVVVLKGAHTSVATPTGMLWFNTTGNPGMAKGGSGDVLTGVLTGLLAQQFAASEAAILGVFLHGRAGDLAAAKKGQSALLAGDLMEFLGAAAGD